MPKIKFVSFKTSKIRVRYDKLQFPADFPFPVYFSAKWRKFPFCECFPKLITGVRALILMTHYTTSNEDVYQNEWVARFGIHSNGQYQPRQGNTKYRIRKYKIPRRPTKYEWMAGVGHSFRCWPILAVSGQPLLLRILFTSAFRHNPHHDFHQITKYKYKHKYKYNFSRCSLEYYLHLLSNITRITIFIRSPNTNTNTNANSISAAAPQNTIYICFRI